MKNTAGLISFTGFLLTALSSGALDLKQSKFTQVVNDVQIISGADKSAKTVALNDLFKMPDILRTGPNSRAELVAEDQTITRVGANTIFSFDSANRTIDLQKGSLLFHSPKGKGGGTIQTGSATASVLGTTIVVTTTSSGGFKILVLEGVAEVKFLNGLKQHLSAGQMTFILPGGGMSPIIVFRLDSNTKASQLVNGFDHPLPSTGKIGDAVNQQTKLIIKGRAQDTGLIVGDKASATQVEAIDPSVTQNYLNRYLNHTTTPQVYNPVRVGDSYRTVDGFLVTPQNETEPVADALAPARALSTDANLKSSKLDSHYTFLSTGPFNVTIPTDPDRSGFLPNPFSGVFGRNINIQTKNIDMTPYASVAKFDFLAAQDINIGGSVSFDGLMEAIYLTAAGQILIAPGSTLAAETYFLSLSSCDAMHFNRVTIQNPAGISRLATLADLSLNNCSISSGFETHLFGQTGINLVGTSVSAGLETVEISSDAIGVGATPAISINTSTLTGSTVDVTGGGDVNVNNSTITSISPHALVSLTSSAGSLNVNGGSIQLSPGGGDLARAGRIGKLAAAGQTVRLSGGLDVNVAGTTINAGSISATAGRSITINGGATFTAPTVTLTAGNGILLDNVTMHSSSLQMQAVNDINMGGAAHEMDLSSLTDVNISGNTLVFQNVNFGGNPNLQSDVGLLADNPNTRAAVQRGYVNFFDGVTYNLVLITSENQGTYVNPLTGSGIHISPRVH